MREDADLLWTRLRDAGYRQGHVGKWHNETPHKPDHYIEDFVSEHDYGAWRKGQGLPPKPRENVWFGEVDPHITPEQHRLAWSSGTSATCSTPTKPTAGRSCSGGTRASRTCRT